MEKERFLTIREAAAELGSAASTIHNAVYERRLPFVLKYGRKVIDRLDLDAYKQRTRPAGEKPKGRPLKGQGVDGG